VLLTSFRLFRWGTVPGPFGRPCQAELGHAPATRGRTQISLLWLSHLACSREYTRTRGDHRSYGVHSDRRAAANKRS
jgi:hypothetical protein